MNNFVDILQTSGSSMGVLALFVAFIGGVIASISPCSLSMLPIIIGYVGGYSKEKPSATLVQMIFFVIGMSLVFSGIGIICALTGRVFVSVAPSYFLLVIASFLLLMGLNVVGILDFNLPVFIKQMPTSSNKGIILYPMLLGVVFALAGTPCSTPILAGIMALAAISEKIWYSVLMLFLFSLGQGLILILAAVFTSTVKGLKKFANYSDMLMRASGVFLIFASLYIFYKVFSPFF